MDLSNGIRVKRDAAGLLSAECGCMVSFGRAGGTIVLCPNHERSADAPLVIRTPQTSQHDEQCRYAGSARPREYRDTLDTERCARCRIRQNTGRWSSDDYVIREAF